MYTLKELPYLYQDLEPFIDTHTVGLHYQKHAKNYLKKLNDLLIKNHFDFSYPLEDIPMHINEFPKEDQEDILFNAGGVLNHQMYFYSMSAHPEVPMGKFLAVLQDEFGSLEKLMKTFKELSLNLKGSGYVFLVVDKNNKLALLQMKNQDTPYTYGLVPLLCIDMWEHAYYLNVQNNKELYLDNFSKIIDFTYANKYFN